MAPPQKKSAQGGNILTRKLGPLPGWGWLVVAVVGYYLYRKMAGGTSATSSTTTGAQNPPTATVTLPGGASYTGPAGGAPSFVSAVAPGQGAAGTSPGSGAGTPGTFQAVPMGTGTATALAQEGVPLFWLPPGESPSTNQPVAYIPGGLPQTPTGGYPTGYTLYTQQGNTQAGTSPYQYGK